MAKGDHASHDPRNKMKKVIPKKLKENNKFWTKGKIGMLVALLLIISVSWLYLPFWIYKTTGQASHCLSLSC